MLNGFQHFSCQQDRCATDPVPGATESAMQALSPLQVCDVRLSPWYNRLENCELVYRYYSYFSGN